MGLHRRVLHALGRDSIGERERQRVREDCLLGSFRTRVVLVGSVGVVVLVRDDKDPTQVGLNKKQMMVSAGCSTVGKTESRQSQQEFTMVNVTLYVIKYSPRLRSRACGRF